MMVNTNVLLVEGTDDEHVLYALLNHYQVPTTFTIKNKKGIDNLLGTLDVELLASDLRYLGIIVDADEDLPSRWRSLQNILRSSGYTSTPQSPDPEGTIIVEKGRPSIGIWMMPDNMAAGMLEHFIEFLIPSHDRLWEYAVECTEGISEHKRRFSREHVQKASLHAWLAWQSDPGTPLGLAITKRYLDARAEHARRLIAWISRLFEI